MKLIPLTQGKFAQVDDADFESLNQFKWHSVKAPRTWYAVRTTSRKLGPQRAFGMHRQMLGTTDHKKAFDHVDGNGLNNQRENLRPCIASQNCMNRNKPENASSKYKGVRRKKTDRVWEASIGGCGNRVKTPYKYLGRFQTEEDAARAYDTAARELYGEFARLNFPIN